MYVSLARAAYKLLGKGNIAKLGNYFGIRKYKFEKMENGLILQCDFTLSSHIPSHFLVR